MDGEILATTPDLICLVDTETFTPVPTDALKYGKRVLVGWPSSATTCGAREKGIELVGPRYFGLDADYIPARRALRAEGGVSMYKLGIDVGGTNTDAVLIDESLNVVAAVKKPTSGDIYDGHHGRGGRRAGGERTSIASSSSRRCWAPRSARTPSSSARASRPSPCCASARRRRWASRPWSTGPTISRRCAVDYRHHRAAALNTTASVWRNSTRPRAARFFEGVQRQGRIAVAISCVFSTVRDDDELRAAEIAREVLGEDVHVSISSEIGSMGLVERENATILNAALHRRGASASPRASRRAWPSKGMDRTPRCTCRRTTARS